VFFEVFLVSNKLTFSQHTLPGIDNKEAIVASCGSLFAKGERDGQSQNRATSVSEWLLQAGIVWKFPGNRTNLWYKCVVSERQSTPTPAGE
jgi:hypothetical protein